VYRPKRLLALVLLSIAAMAGPLGCGDDDGGGGDDGSGGGGVPPEEPPEEPVADSGCTADAPTRVGATDPGYDGWLILCVTGDRSVLRIKNTSGNSFVVWTTDDDTYLDMTAVPPTDTWAGYLASTAVPPGDDDGNGAWALPPESTLVAANDYGPAGVRFQLSARDTAAFNTAHSSGAYVDRLAVSRSQALVNKGLACADSAANAVEEQSRLDLALDAIKVQTTCQGFLNDAIQQDGQVADDTQSAWRRFLANAKRLAGGNWDDELAYGIARLARR
jgi:hypothetical protein